MDRWTVADLVLQDAQQLAERAENEGVTAYARRPVQRERPNQRFLRNTILNVESANKRAQEEEMWARRQAQVHRRSSPLNQSSASSEHDEDGDNAKHARHRKRAIETTAVPEEVSGDDDLVDEVLAKKRPRGRGGIGSRMDLAGPYLDVQPGDELVNEDIEITRVLGPTKPDWMAVSHPKNTLAGTSSAKASSSSSSEEGSSSSDDEERSGRGRWQLDEKKSHRKKDKSKKSKDRDRDSSYKSKKGGVKKKSRKSKKSKKEKRKKHKRM